MPLSRLFRERTEGLVWEKLNPAQTATNNHGKACTQAASESHQVGLCRALPFGMKKGFQSEDGFCVNLAHTGFRDF